MTTALLPRCARAACPCATLEESALWELRSLALEVAKAALQDGADPWYFVEPTPALLAWMRLHLEPGELRRILAAGPPRSFPVSG